MVKEIEGDNDDMLKEDTFSVEVTDEGTGNKEIEQANTDIAVCEDIAFWPRTCSGLLIVNFVTLRPKSFKTKMNRLLRL